MHTLLTVGKIVGVHGIKGGLKIKPYAEDTTFFSADRFVIVKDKAGQKNNYTVSWAAPYNKGIRLGLKEISSRNQAENLVGGEICTHKADLPELEDGTYYWFDLIGLAVSSASGDFIGRVENVMETGSNDVYVVRDGDREVLIPALASVVLDIDLEQKTMQVDLPEGL